MTENTQYLDSHYFDRPTCASLAYPSTLAMVDGTASSHESNWLIAGKRNNGAYHIHLQWRWWMEQVAVMKVTG